MLCDINVILDIFLEREPFYCASADLFEKIEEGVFKGYLCALSFPTIHYLLSQEHTRGESLNILKKIRIVFEISPVEEKTIDQALASDFRDFEDAVQYYSAINSQVDCIVTRNKKDFSDRKIPALTPMEFLELEMHMETYGE